MNPIQLVRLTATNRGQLLSAVRAAPVGTMVGIGSLGPTHAQLRIFHALVQTIADSGTPFAGRARSAQEWKLLLLSAHAQASGEPGLALEEGLEGELLVLPLRESLATMDRARASSLIEYTLDWALQHGIIPAFSV